MFTYTMETQWARRRALYFRRNSIVMGKSEVVRLCAIPCSSRIIRNFHSFRVKMQKFFDTMRTPPVRLSHSVAHELQAIAYVLVDGIYKSIEHTI